MALRMKVRGVLGVVVDGRVRDRAELKASGLGIWARGGSTVGSGAEAKAGEMGGEVCVSGVIVREVCHFCPVELGFEGVVWLMVYREISFSAITRKEEWWLYLGSCWIGCSR